MNEKQSDHLNFRKMDNSILLPGKLTFDVFIKQSVINKTMGIDVTKKNNHIFNGLVGHGVQNWCRRIIWQTPFCGVALDIPVRGAYSEIEKNDNLAAQEIGDMFINACLTSTQSGLYFRNQEVRLYIVMDADEFTFRLFSMNTDEMIYESSGLIELLDILDYCHNKKTNSGD